MAANPLSEGTRSSLHNSETEQPEDQRSIAEMAES